MRSIKYVSAFVGLLIVSFLCTTTASVGAVTCTSVGLDNKTDDELRAIERACEAEKAEQEALLKTQQGQTTSIERDIGVLNTQISKSQSSIKESDAKIARLKREIAQRGQTILQLSDQQKRVEESLAAALRRIDALEETSTLEVLLANESMAHFFERVDSLTEVNRNLNALIVELGETKAKNALEQELFASEQSNEQGLKLVKEQETQKIQSYKKEKDQLKTLSKAKENEYRANIAEKEKIRNQIRARIFKTVSGEAISFGDALDLVKPYERLTGTPSALLLSVLFQESGANDQIGGNLGRCTYNQSWTNKSGTVMSDSQKDAFLTIMTEIGMDPNKAPVSCPIPQDGAYGGAMGPAQFMPNTWLGYRRSVERVLGIQSASPFRNQDAFIASALYLSEAIRRCESAFSSEYDVWRCAGAKYYAGLNITLDTSLGRHMNGYGMRVAKRAQQFQEDIDTLDF